MHIGPVVDWERDVLAAWRRSANNAERPNSDVWGKLPEHVCWLSARIEESDLAKLHVIGSCDWAEVFRTYRLSDVASCITNEGDDKHKHTSRIRDMGKAYAAGHRFERIAVVSFSGSGPFVVIDGCHRVVAMRRQNILVGQDVFLGLHADIGTSFVWFRQAVQHG